MTSTRPSNFPEQKQGVRDIFQITVRLLENENSITLLIPELANGKWLLDEVCRRQEVLPEIEYFGLRYISCELLSAPTKHWLKLTKPIRTQLKHTHPRLVSFRIKHYPPDPFNDLKLDKSKYLLFHQLHRDFLGGRLIAPHDDLIRLAALFLQVTLGDASVIEASFAASQSSFSSGEASTYLSNYRALHGGSSRKTEIEIVDEHRKLEGLLPSEAAAEVIRAALRQPSYGLEPFRVLAKHKKSRPMHVGLTHEGVAEFIGSKRVQLYKWTSIVQFFYSGRHFIMVYQKPLSNGRKSANGTAEYKCESRSIASELWSWALERKLFFTLEKSSVIKPIATKYNLFSRRHTFTFIGRCRSEVMAPKPSSATLLDSHRVIKGTPHSITSQGFHSLHYQTTSAAPIVTGSKSLNDFTSPSTSSTEQGVIIEEEQSLGEFSDIAETSEQSVLIPKEPPDFVKLAPYFEFIPNRKYSSLSRIRQKRCVNLAKEVKRGNEVSGDGLYVNDVLDKLATDTLDFKLESPAITQNKALSPPAKNTYPFSSLSDVRRTNRADSRANGNSDFSGTHMEDQKETTDEDKTKDEECAMVFQVWKQLLIAGGIGLAIAFFGASMLSEFGLQIPLFSKVPGSFLFINWEYYCYRPLRSFLLGFSQ